MEFRVLGPLEVIHGGEALALGGPRQRVVLASLILEANHVVPTDRLIARIWGDEPPDRARGALFSYISRLRRLLGSDRIQARPPGYILLAGREEVDAIRFVDLVDRARRQADREPARALLTDALDLWRGGALSDLAEHDGLRPAITRLDESRLDALVDRLEVEIDLRRHRETVPMLETLTAEYPLRERLWVLLMVALYRSGRQADALGSFHRARTTLVEQLGIDPSPELRLVHDQVLRQDPALELPSAGRAATTERLDGRASTTMAPLAADVAGGGPEKAGATGPVLDVTGVLRGSAMRKAMLLGGFAVAVVAVVAGVVRSGTPAGLPDARWTLGVDVPLTGGRAHLGTSVRNAVQMAVDEINSAGGIGGSRIALEVLDDGDDPDRAAANAKRFVTDPATFAMIGPWGSAEAFAVVPVTNPAGLLECSPASSHPGLTKPRFGALDLRAARPDAINFVRVAPSDDIQAAAMAAFAYRDLASSSALVIDDTAVGRDIADAFEVQFIALGGATIRRALNPGADPNAVLTSLVEGANPPSVVFFGGEPETGALVRRAMVDAGRSSTPLLSWDFLWDGSGAKAGSYIHRLGAERARGTYLAHASLPDHRFAFADSYLQRFGSPPDEYAAGAYACVEIIATALRGIATRGPQVSEVRELLRASVVDPTRRYETTLGTIGFDGNGDALQQFVKFFSVEPSAADGAGDWVVFKRQDFGPAR